MQKTINSENELDIIKKIYEQSKMITSCHISKLYFVSASNEVSNYESNFETDIIFDPVQMYQKKTSSCSETPIETYVTDKEAYERGLDKKEWYTLNKDRVDYALQDIYMTFPTIILERFVNYVEYFNLTINEVSYQINIDATENPLLDVALESMIKKYSYSPVSSLEKMKNDKTYKKLEYTFIADKNTYNIKEMHMLYEVENLICGIIETAVVENHIKVSNHNVIKTIIIPNDVKDKAEMNCKNTENSSRAIKAIIKSNKPNTSVESKGMAVYTINNNAVYYGKTKIKAADNKSFNIVTTMFGIDNKNVFFKSKKTDLDLNTFSVLNDLFVKDKTQVYYIMKSKLKPIKADVNSFQVLNDYFGKDKSYIFYLNKRIKVNDRASFKIINKGFAYDKHYIYVENNRFKHNIKNEIVFSDVIISSGQKQNVLIVLNDSIFFLDQFYYIDPLIIKEADSDTIKFVNGDYLVDKNHYYYQDKIIENNSGQIIKLLDKDDDILMLDNKIFLFGEKIANVDKATFGSIGYYYYDRNNVYGNITQQAVIKRVIKPLSYSDEELKQSLDLILSELFYYYDLFTPVVFFSKRENEGYIPDLPEYELVIEGSQISIIYGERKISGKISAFTLLGAKFWSIARGVTIDDEPIIRTLFYQQDYENGYRLIDNVQKICSKELIRFALYFYKHMEIEESTLIMYKLVNSAHEFERVGSAMDMLSCCSYELLTLATVIEEDIMTQTTYLAVAKEAIKLYDDESYLVRLRCAKKIIAVITCTFEIEKFYESVILKLMNMIRTEKVEHIKEILYQSIEISISMLYVQLKNDRGELYKKIYSLVKFQISENINTDLNTARLWECAHVAGTADEIKQLREKLLNLVQLKIKAAPIRRLEESYPNYRLWLVHATIRIAYLGDTKFATRMIKRAMKELDDIRRTIPICSVSCFIMLQQELIELCVHRNITLPFENHTNDNTLSGVTNRYKTMIESNFAVYEIELLDQGHFVIADNPLKPTLSISKVHSGEKLEIPMGQSIGVEYFIEGQPWGRRIQTEVRVYHPYNINGNEFTQYNSYNYIGLRNSFYWTMEEAEELQEGKWTIVVSFPELEIEDISVDFIIEVVD